MTLEQQFREHSNRYTLETCYLSFLDAEHADYKAIHAMGAAAIPFMLDDLNKQKGSPWAWFTLLEELTGVHPFSVTESGRYSCIRLAWLKWGQENGYSREILPTHEELQCEELLNSIPEEYSTAHKLSSHHREAIEKSKIVGCFYCCDTFPPSEIEEWIDGGTTARCPHCGIDSVLPATLDLSPTFLSEMRKQWF